MEPQFEEESWPAPFIAHVDWDPVGDTSSMGLSDNEYARWRRARLTDEELDKEDNNKDENGNWIGFVNVPNLQERPPTPTAAWRAPKKTFRQPSVPPGLGYGARHTQQRGTKENTPCKCPGSRFCGLLVEEEDEPEPLHNLESLKPSEGWIKMTAVVDSGAGDNVIPKDSLPFVPLHETERSRNNRGFRGPGGEPIQWSCRRSGQNG